MATAAAAAATALPWLPTLLWDLQMICCVLTASAIANTLADVVVSADCIVAIGVVAGAGSAVVPAMEERTQALFEMTVCQTLRFESNNIKGIISR